MSQDHRHGGLAAAVERVEIAAAQRAAEDTRQDLLAARLGNIDPAELDIPRRAVKDGGQRCGHTAPSAAGEADAAGLRTAK